MKEKRTIIIKNPQLQKIRNNLRIILIKFAQDQLFHLQNNLRNLTAKEKEEGIAREINRKKKDIRKIIDGSICKCSRCSAPDKDMTYNPVRKVWYCVECYKELQDYYKGKIEASQYP